MNSAVEKRWRRMSSVNMTTAEFTQPEQQRRIILITNKKANRATDTYETVKKILHCLFEVWGEVQEYRAAEVLEEWMKTPKIWQKIQTYRFKKLRKFQWGIPPPPKKYWKIHPNYAFETKDMETPWRPHEEWGITCREWRFEWQQIPYMKP